MFDVIVVGAGHAGCEAALAAARLGVRVGLITIPDTGFATMPCNPAVGGIAKSHLVYELDALGGEIARNTDYCGLQFRTLNAAKGPAVQATRVQCDKQAYAARMAAVVGATPLITVVNGTVADLLIEAGKLKGVITDTGRPIRCKHVVITAGTFLKGRVHIGDVSAAGGREGVPAAEHLSETLRRLGFRVGRLKTGTPPRLHRDSLDYARMTLQPGLEPPPLISWAARQDRAMFHVEQSPDNAALAALFHVEHLDSAMRPWAPGHAQIPCHLTQTTADTHGIIAENIKHSAMYSGAISGTGVRYCPCIEDKIVKFADKSSHHIFLEPESRDGVSMYPNGISNSLPAEVQLHMVQSIPGFERAEVLAWGYAIEYDYCDPTQLTHALESRLLEGLFLAGQLNGTTGYEEAAAQGFMAGVNAAHKALGKAPFVLSRNEAYIGVMVDDLVTKGVDEPYRMFTSRAERRLLLRQDNARFRMHTHASALGIVPAAYLAETAAMRTSVEAELRRIGVREDSVGGPAKMLRRPEIRYRDLPTHDPSLPPEVQDQVEICVKYQGYIAREERLAQHAREAEAIRIPVDLDYFDIPALRYEAREKLDKIRPESLGQAARISGVNPADISILAILLKR